MKKALALILVVILVLTLCACGGPKAGPEQQVVTIDIMGDVDVTFVRNPADKTFSYSYEAFGNPIKVEGTYTDDANYTVTNDPSGKGALALDDIVAKLRADAWTPVK
jgi:predicted small lipoprotein YifL